MLKVRFSKWALIVASMLIGGVLALSIQIAVGDDDTPQDLPLNELRTYAEVFQLIKEGYVEPVKNKALIDSSIRGMLSELDPHSNYFDAKEYKDFSESTQGQFGGLGMEISPEKDGSLKVIAPMDDTPAQKAGIKSGDVIIKVNDKLTNSMSTIEAVQLIRGAPGTPVTLTITREHATTPIVITAKRAIIKIKSVRFALLEKNYGYLRITQFQENTHKDVVQGINALYRENKEPLKGLVIDLRDNPGGLLNAAVGVSAIFLPKDSLVVYTKGRARDAYAKFYASPAYYMNSSRREADPNQWLPSHVKSLPIVVLINSGSASASEIVAGALQDYKRACLIGTSTFGKGSVQSVIPLLNGGGIKLTIAYYFTPRDRSIQAKGITPDKVVEDKSNTSPIEAWNIREANLKNHLANPDNKETTQSTNATAKKSEDKPPIKAPNNKIPAGSATKPDPQQDYQLNQALETLKKTH